MFKRTQRVNQLIKKELSQIILKEVDFPKGVLVTLTRVKTSQDLEQAKAYISVMPKKQSLQVLEVLNQQIYYLQRRLDKRLKTRPIPKIEFREEEETAEAGRIEELLEKIHEKDT